MLKIKEIKNIKEITDYDFPQDLNKMSTEELELLALQIRDFLLTKVSRTGGHLASNLGIVELTIALHKVFDSPKDKIIWDVGHQSYVHKILTGRAKGFDELRQNDGMSGFPKRRESPHDVYETGHSSTSLSAAAGMAAARDLKKDKYEIIPVIGDGSLTGGMAYEALNNIGSRKSKVIVILNDNGMSISKNIGSVPRHLGKLRTSRKYVDTKNEVRMVLDRIPGIGAGISQMLVGAKHSLKYILLSGGIMFEELGFTYLGPINGHNIEDVIGSLKQAKKADGPVLVHVMTKKGKGYRNAEKNPGKFHGIGPFDKETGEALKKSEYSFSSVMGEKLLSLADKDERVVGITAAMESATGLGPLHDRYPKRCFDVGIAEAHAVTFAAGLAASGMKPFVAIYSSFLQRAYDQIIVDVCLQNLPVVFTVDRAGVVGEDGETHHGVFDLAYLSILPNMTVLAPADGNDLQFMMEYALSMNKPVAIRYPRGGCEQGDKEQVYHGGNSRLCDGSDGDIWAVGSMVSHGLKAREILAAQGLHVGVVAVSEVKPADRTLLEKKNRRIFTLEDGMIIGGYGQYMGAQLPPEYEILSLGWPDSFIEHGTPAELYHRYRLDGEGIAERIREYIEGKA